MPAVRRGIQQSQESAQRVAQRHGLHVKTVTKRRNRGTTTDAPMGPQPISTVLTAEQEAGAAAVRQPPHRPLDGGRYALREAIPPRSRPARHRLFHRPGIRRLPAPEPAAKKKKCKGYPIGYCRVDFAAAQTAEGKGALFVARDRTSKPAFAEVPPRAPTTRAAAFLRRARAAIPCKAHNVVTDTGTQFGNRPHQGSAWRPVVARVCDEQGLEHRFAQPAHSRATGQVERFHRALKEAPVRQHHYQTTAQLTEHLHAFLPAHNHGNRLKRLRGKTPHAFICQQGRLNPTILSRDPTQLTPGLYT